MIVDLNQWATGVREALLRELGIHADAGYPERVPVVLRTHFRALRASLAVSEYADRDGGDEGEPAEQYVRDLLTDLMHLVSLSELDFADLLAQAQGMFLDEQGEDL